MKLKSLALENFRNYSKYSYIFPEDKDLILLIGQNGEGKTNILEAIYSLSLGKSFRTSHNRDLIKWENDYFRVQGKIEGTEEEAGLDETKLELFYSERPKRSKGFKKNDVRLKNSEFIGNLLTVLFHPEDLNMLYLSPSLRRRYLDIVLSQTDKKYLDALSNYKKVLKQRAALLHTIRDARFKNSDTAHLEADLDAWDRELISFGSQIIEKRQNYIEFLNERIKGLYQEIADDEDEIEIKYQSKVLKPNSEAIIFRLFEEEVQNRRSRDIIKAETSAGPHRDDLLFFLNGKDINSSASRGEFRTLLLAIKLAEIRFIQDRSGFSPILLLDDVFSELDPERQIALIKAVEGCQTVITATDLNGLGEVKDSPRCTIVKID